MAFMASWRSLGSAASSICILFQNKSYVRVLFVRFLSKMDCTVIRGRLVFLFGLGALLDYYLHLLFGRVLINTPKFTERGEIEISSDRGI